MAQAPPFEILGRAGLESEGPSFAGGTSDELDGDKTMPSTKMTTTMPTTKVTTTTTTTTTTALTDRPTTTDRLADRPTDRL